jgi:predicted dehydrogenase
VIGAGAWARACHLPVLAARPEVDLVSVSDLDPARAREAAKAFGVRRVTADWHDTFDESVDACVVASPAAAHYEQAAAALAAGAHVLVEKPMVLRRAEAEDLVERARTADRQLLVSFGWNYSELYRSARALFADPGIGRVEHLSVHMASGTRDLLTGRSASSTGFDDVAVAPSTWTDPALSGGGYGQAQLPHALGVALGIVGESVASACAFPGGPEGPVETCVATAGRLSGGGSLSVSGASFHAGLAANRHQLEVRVFGSTGNLLVDFERDELVLDRLDGRIRIDVAAGAGLYDGRGPAEALVDVALGRLGTTDSPGELGARTVAALELVYKSLTARI